ncbi:MAG: response regulator [Bacteroidota bacterium]
MNELSDRSNFLLYREWENILSLLLKEDSFEILSEEILLRSTVQSKSRFGITIFTDELLKDQFDLTDTDYKICDPAGILKTETGIIGEIRPNLSYIGKWLNVNKKILTIDGSNPDSIGSVLSHLLKQKYIAVSPVCFNDNILSISIFARDDSPYSREDIMQLEQLSSLFGFSASTSLTRKLNTTLENQLQQSQKLETIGKLASGMAHDFNNLLSSIFGSLNLLKRKLSDRPDVSYLLDNVENCSVRAAELTKGLLSYGKPTPKRKTLIKPLDLLEELSGVVHETFPDRIKITRCIDERLYDIMGNPTEIYQVLLNLCINAKEAIRDTGEIRIEAVNFIINEKNTFDYPLLRQGSYVCFSVADTGEGIREENLTKIFDPYFSTKQKETGGGLGLYVTYGIIKAHNGHIDVNSKPGKGTRFDVYIPAFTKIQDAQETQTEKIILLADDELMLRDILAELLESYNFQVICVQNGREVLQVLTEEIKADLLIIDYKMPEMDGLSCIKEIRKLELNVPIILSTGSSTPQADTEFERLHIDSILTKPYEFEQMLSAVQKLI